MSVTSLASKSTPTRAPHYAGCSEWRLPSTLKVPGIQRQVLEMPLAVSRAFVLTEGWQCTQVGICFLADGTAASLLG